MEPVASALERLAIAPASIILTALSGGPDSVALFYALLRLQPNFGFRLVAAHLNHGLRGAESDRDENFVRDLCTRHALDLICERAELLSSNLRNLEERARHLRHQFLNRAADRVNARHIALAHHADDQAETVLMRLLRGAGAAGLAAMAERGPGRLFRPMLLVTHAQAIAYLESIGANWIVDSSNRSPGSVRNRIRLELLPLLERNFAPGLKGRLVELALEMRGLDHLIAAAARAELDRRRTAAGLSFTGFHQLDPILAQAVLREFARDQIGSLRRITRDHIASMLRLGLSRRPSGCVPLPGGWQLRREYEVARLEPRPQAVPAEPFRTPIPSRGIICVEPAGISFESEILETPSGAARLLPRDSMEALFDADQVVGALVARNMIPGDRLEQHGIDGRRKVHDVFVDGKLPRARRSHWPLIAADDRILWIPGYARSRVALVTSATTRIQRLRAFESEGLEKSTLLEKCFA
jgi:tRNA(Ile)-lysidine synthase